MYFASLSIKSANLFMRYPRWAASIVLQGEPRRKASFAAWTALSISAYEKIKNAVHEKTISISSQTS